MKCIYEANEVLHIRNSEGVMVTLESGDIVDLPKIPNDKVKMLFPYVDPVVEPEVKPEVKTIKKKKSSKKSSKK